MRIGWREDEVSARQGLPWLGDVDVTLAACYAAADQLGLGDEELAAALEGGVGLAALADARHVEPVALLLAMVGAASTELDGAVASGEIDATTARELRLMVARHLAEALGETYEPPGDRSTASRAEEVPAGASATTSSGRAWATSASARSPSSGRAWWR